MAAARKKKMDLTDKLLIGLGLVAGVVIWRTNDKLNAEVNGVKASVKQVVTKDLNPASPENFIYRGVNKVGATFSGQKGWDLGTAIYDLTH